MSEVQTNDTGLLLTQESALGTAGTTWETVLHNDISDVGADVKTVAADPISPLQQRRGGEMVDLDSPVAYQCDLNMHNWLLHTKFALFAHPNGPAEGLANGEPFRPTAITSTGYTVASGGDIPNGYLIYARGFPTAANNGLKITAGTSTATEIKAAGLVADASVADAENATVEICGIQAGTSDLVVVDSNTITSTVLDFTTLGLTVGQFIWIGGALGGALVFAEGANRGLVRVTAIAANELTFDKSLTTWVADAGTGKTIQIFFGRFFRNVAVSHADYSRFSASFEAAFPELGGASTPAYIYPEGNRLDEMTINFPVADKSGMDLKWVGMDTPNPTTSRASGAADARAVIQDDIMNTSSRFFRLRLTSYDQATTISTYFKTLSLMIKNGVKGWKALATLGNAFLTRGNCLVDTESQIALTSDDAIEYVRNYTQATFEFALRNADGGMAVDLPSVRLGSGKIELPRDEIVLINCPLAAEYDTTFGYTVSFSHFPYIPQT